MKLTVLGSSSSGNCYLLETETECLIIEAGVPFIEVKKKLNFKVGKIVGCIVSHAHGDHAGYIKEYLKYSVDCYANDYLCDKIKSHRLVAVLANSTYPIGNFSVIPFGLLHDVPCHGFVIKHADMGKMVFLTDTYLCEYTFLGVNHWLIEANYDDAILTQNIIDGRVSPAQRNRLMYSHMEIKTTLSMLKANDLSDTNNIVLIHLSSDNSDEKEFVSQVEKATGKPCYAANTGMELILTNQS